MKYLSLFLMCIVTGCSSIQRMTNSDHLTSEERSEKRRQYLAEEQRIQDLKDSIKPGDSEETLRAAWGDPDKKEFTKGMYIYHYDNGDEPIEFGLIDNKVSQWIYDKQGASDIVFQRESQKNRAVAAERERRARLGEALRSLGGSTKNRETCTTQNIGNGKYQTVCDK